MTTYPFEKLFLVCTGSRCNDLKQGDERGDLIRDELKNHNKRMGRKQTVRICSVSCLDLCDSAPAMLIYPIGEVHTELNRTSARAAYDAAMGDD